MLKSHGQNYNCYFLLNLFDITTFQKKKRHFLFQLYLFKWNFYSLKLTKYIKNVLI